MPATVRSKLHVPRTGEAFLDGQIDAYLAAGGTWTVEPRQATMMCNDTSEQFFSYLGAAALIVRAPADWWGYTDRTITNEFTHDVCLYPAMRGGWHAVDFTAAQYGLMGTFPLISHTPCLGELTCDDCQSWDEEDIVTGEHPRIMTPARPDQAPAWRRLT